MTVYHKTPLPKIPMIKPGQNPIDPGAKGGIVRTPLGNVVELMIERGDVHQRPEDSKFDPEDPDLLEEFGRLLYVGAPEAIVRSLLRMKPKEYWDLKKRHIEHAVESLSSVGVVGMVAMSFDKMEEASRRALQLAANLGESNPSQLLAALRLVKDIEAEKIDLLVRTGAIKVKKKVEISGSMDVGRDPDHAHGEKAQKVMLNIMSLMELGGDDEDSPRRNDTDEDDELSAASSAITINVVPT